MRIRRLYAIVGAYLSLSGVPAAIAGDVRFSVSQPAGGEGLVDPGLREARSLELPADGSTLRLPLPFEVTLGGDRYQAVEVSGHGWARLVSGAGAASREAALGPVRTPRELGADSQREVGSGKEPASVTLRVLSGPLVRRPAARLLYYEGTSFLSLRWYGYGVGPLQDPAVFELLLAPSGDVRYQYYVLPAAGLAGFDVGYETAAAGSVNLRAQNAFVPRASSALDLSPTDQPETADKNAPASLSPAACSACGTDPAWCVQARNSNAQCTAYVDANTCATVRAAGYSCCTDTNQTSWGFWEQAFCVGCAYTFYALVECGTEMHLPLDDMEGVRVRVTEFLTGRPIPITCQNQQYKVPGFHLVNCDRAPVGPGPEDSYYDSPQLNKDNGTDATQYVSWGFDDAVPCQTVADVKTCTNWPAGSGTLAVSAGEQQTTDCFITDPVGICGLYRIDVISGGNGWHLFANCDGSATPRYSIYDSCNEACAAYNPRPELTVNNLKNTGVCPTAQVEFDVTNIGCTAASPVNYRISSSCSPTETKDGAIAGGIAGNATQHVVDSLALSCSPATITVTVDPDDQVAECSESASITKCTDIPGQSSLQTTTCTCAATLNPAAGADLSHCVAQPFTLDASTSSAAGCTGSVEYRWVEDASGTVVCPWGAATSCVPTGQPFAPGTVTYRLEQRCTDETVCVATDLVNVTVYDDPVASAGADVETCAGDLAGVLLGGNGASPTGSSGSGSFSYAWSPATGLSGTAVPNPIFHAPAAGSYDFDVLVTDTITGCTATDRIHVVAHPALVVDAGADREFCLGAQPSTPLGGAPTAAGGAGSGYAYNWIGLGGAASTDLSSTTDPNPTYTPSIGNDPPGATYQLTVTDAAGCATTSSVTVVVDWAPQADAGADQGYCLGETVPLGGAPSGTCYQSTAGCTYAWSPSVGLSCTNCSNPMVTPSADTVYTLTVTDPASGCPTESTVAVTLRTVNPGGPQDLGNKLLAVRTGADREDATFSWSWTDPSVMASRVRRSADRTFATSTVVAASLPATQWIDPGVVSTGSTLLVYRISGTDCSGAEGPF